MDIRKVLVVLFSVYLVACSSGGSDEGSSDPSLSVQTKTAIQAKQTYDTLRKSKYSGIDSQASVSQESLAAFSSSLLFELMTPEYAESDESVGGPISRSSFQRSQNRFDVFSNYYLPIQHKVNLKNNNLGIMTVTASQAKGEIYEVVDNEYECSESGRITEKGIIYEPTVGNYLIGGIDIVYEQCKDEFSYFNGRAASYLNGDGTSTNYYGGLLIETGNKKFTVTGSIDYFENSGVINALIQRADKSSSYQLIDWEIYPYVQTIEGKLYHSDYGFLELSSIENYQTNYNSSFPVSGKVSFEGNSTSTGALLFYSNEEGLLSIDLDNDSQADQMNIFDYYTLVAGKPLGDFVAYEEPNYPPSYSYFYFENDTVNTTNDIEVSIDGVSDPEQDSINISYKWKINGQEVTDINSHVLVSGTAQKNQVVTVTADISDGRNIVTTEELSLVIQDAPASLSFSSLPSTHLLSDELSFSVDMIDPDAADSTSNTSSLSLMHGPAGMELADGQVTWTPSNLLFGQSQTFYFGFEDSLSMQTLTGSIEVTDPNAKPLLARSGIEVPHTERSISVGQFDDDSSIEILMTDSKNLIFTLEKDGTSYKQDWLYPYALSDASIQQVISHDTNDDGILDIIALTTEGVYLITDRKELASTIFKDSEKEFQSISLLQKLDGNVELVLLAVDGFLVIDLDGDIVSNIKLSSPGDIVLTGNVDSDLAQEIVLSGGYVYDGESYANQWYYPSGFGAFISVLNVDGSGESEIIGMASSSYSSQLKLFSANSKSSFWTGTSSYNVCSMNSGELSSSYSGEELVLGDCSGNVRAFGLTKSNETELWNVRTGSYSGVSSITVSNIDDDSQNEVLMGSGTRSSGRDGFNVVNINGSEVSISSTSDVAQLDSFVAAGIAQVTPDEQKAIFVIPRTNSGYSAQRVVSMDMNGDYSVSDALGTNWDRAKFAEVSDYDQDGYAELFYGSAETYDGSFNVSQLSDMNVEWTTGGTYDDTIKTIVVKDVNADTFDDAIYVNNRHVVVSDIYNEVLIWESADFSYGIQDLAVANIDGLGKPEIIVASSDSLSVWAYNDSSKTYIQESSTSKDCKRITPIPREDSLTMDIFCLDDSYYYSSNKSRLYRLDSKLADVNNFILDHSISEVIVENTTSDKKNLLIASTSSNSYYSPAASSISMISAQTGALIWSSPKLPGSIPPHSLYHYLDGDKSTLNFATQDAMFITQ